MKSLTNNFDIRKDCRSLYYTKNEKERSQRISQNKHETDYLDTQIDHTGNYFKTSRKFL